jgi:hypothetical protein
VATGEARRIARESDVFCRYLSGAPPSAYVRDKYAAGQAAVPPNEGVAPALDRALLATARAGVMGARLADAYAGRFTRRATLRARLTLMLAILENAPGVHARFDTAVVDSRAAAMVKTGLALAGVMLRTAVAVAIFGPLHLASRRRRAVARDV